MNSSLFSFYINQKPSVCKKKAKFPTKADAIKNRKKLIARRGDAGRKSRVFYCVCCKSYHVGKPLKNQEYEKIEDSQEEQFIKQFSEPDDTKPEDSHMEDS